MHEITTAVLPIPRTAMSQKFVSQTCFVVGVESSVRTRTNGSDL